jgi:hypothetical protein
MAWDITSDLSGVTAQHYLTVKCAVCGKWDCFEHTAPAQAEWGTSYRLTAALDCYKPTTGLPPPPERKPHVCPKCEGYRVIPLGNATQVCPTCRGSGTVWEDHSGMPYVRGYAT